MKKNYFFVLLIVLSNCLIAQDNFQKVRIHLEGSNLSLLQNIHLDIDHGHYQAGKHFTTWLSDTDIAKLNENNIKYDVLFNSVSDFLAHENASHRAGSGDCQADFSLPNVPSRFTLGSMGGYFTYDEMLHHLDSMIVNYPSLISPRFYIDSSNLSIEGRPIWGLKISDNPNTNESEPQVLLTAVHHAREPLSLSQLIMFMYYLLENYGSNPEITFLVDNTEIYFVPMVNPDGYVRNYTTNPAGGGMWRKNRRNNGDGTFGVDLNRNYGYEWGYDNFGSSPATNNETYRGTSGFSEPETRAIKSFCETHDFKVALNYHTYGELLIYPWGYSDAPTVDSAAFFGFADYLTKENQFTAGTGTSTVGYTTNGDSDDWMYGEQSTKNKIFSMTPEAGTEFWQPASEIIPYSQELLIQNTKFIWLVHNSALLTDRTPDLLSSVSGSINFHLDKIGMESGSFTVNAYSLTPGFSVSDTVTTPSMLHLDSLNNTFAYMIDKNILTTSELKYYYEVNNGIITHRDTFTTNFGEIVDSYLNNCNNIMGWVNSGSKNWSTSNTIYHSASSSIHDSPDGDYDNLSTYRLTTSSAINLAGMSKPRMRCWLLWDVESGYDYAQILGSSDGVNFTPLCGKYTKSGTSNQDAGNPVYDGTQNTWVQEDFDLSDFAGGDFYVRLYLQSDNFVTGDGFYFDDMEVYEYELPASDTCDGIDLHANISLNPSFFCEDTVHYCFCQYDSIHLMGSGGDFVVWNTGDTMSGLNYYGQDLLAGGSFSELKTYFITVYDTTLGCYERDTAQFYIVICGGFEELNESSINVYPNPANELVKFELDGNHHLQNIGLYDINGKQIRYDKFTGKQELDIHDLSNGIYLLKFYLDDGILTKRLVVLR